jgi:hypothetical protein
MSASVAAIASGSLWRVKAGLRDRAVIGPDSAQLRISAKRSWELTARSYKYFLRMMCKVTRLCCAEDVLRVSDFGG